MRAGLRPLTLRSRLVLLFIAGATAVLVGAAMFLFVAIDRSLLEAVDEGLRARAGDLEAVLQDDNGTFPTRDPFAQVIASDGTVLFRSPSTGDPRPVITPAEIASASSGTTVVREVHDLGGESRLLMRRIDFDGGSAVLVVGSSLDQYRHTRQRLVLVLAVVGPALLATMAAAGWLLAGAALRPVRRMADEAEDISIADLSRRLAVPLADDEIAHLARTLNGMLERVEHAIGHERRFIDDASHELRTPLTILRGELELALTQAEDVEEMRDAIRSSLDEAERLSRLSEDLLVLARARAGELRVRSSPVDVLASAQKVSELLAGAGVDVECEGEPVQVLADPDRLDQILMNLVANGQRFARTRVRVRVTPATGTGPLAPGLGVRLLIADDGPGFDPGLLPITFERFRRSDPARQRGTGGAGLGLAIAAELVRAHGGTIDAGNGSALGGAWVEVWLPRLVRHDHDAAPANRTRSRQPPGGATYTAPP